METGEVFATQDGTTSMPPWCADSLDTGLILYKSLTLSILICATEKRERDDFP